MRLFEKVTKLVRINLESTFGIALVKTESSGKDRASAATLSVEQHTVDVWAEVTDIGDYKDGWSALPDWRRVFVK